MEIILLRAVRIFFLLPRIGLDTTIPVLKQWQEKLQGHVVIEQGRMTLNWRGQG